MVSKFNEKVFAALGDNTRFEIVEFLKGKDEVRAGDIVDHIGGSAPSISRHLRILRMSGVLKMRAVSQTRLYSIDLDVMNGIQRWAHSVEVSDEATHRKVE